VAARIIDGRAIAAQLTERISDDVALLKERHGITPGLAVVLVGQDPASQIYVRNKVKKTRELGMASIRHSLPEDASQEELLELINRINCDPKIHGLLVQLPLPGPIDEASVIEAIRPDKDVDGFHISNVGLLSRGKRGVVPCTPLGCLMLLKHELGSLEGCDAMVLGRSNIVGKPLANVLLHENCTVTIAHSRTRNLAEQCRRADILIAAVGRPALVKGSWIKPGATVIDVGINRLTDRNTGRSKIVGDVDFQQVSQIAGAVTPVPGGVGPMTIACLLANTYQACCRIHKLDDMPDASRV